MNPVIHFEIPAKDKKLMAEFYTKTFDWQAIFLGPETGAYVLLSTTESDQNGRPKNPGAINGGMFQKTDDPCTHHPSVVIGVDNIQESMQKVVEEGGKVYGEPMEIPGVGLYVAFEDPEGNRGSLMQPKM
jgi:predicted enzyme related to lactoylglutathione lyase